VRTFLGTREIEAPQVSERYQKKERAVEDYFFFGFALAFGLAFAAALTGFIGAPQQINSAVSQPQGSSTTTISPQSSHLYFSPFFAKIYTCLKILQYISCSHSNKIIQIKTNSPKVKKRDGRILPLNV
jgi:hypothetical protein